MPSKSGRHHNRNGLRQIKKGSLARNTKRLANRLGIPYRNPTTRATDICYESASSEHVWGSGQYSNVCIACGKCR